MRVAEVWREIRDALHHRAERQRIGAIGPDVKRALRDARAAEQGWRLEDARAAWAIVVARAPAFANVHIDYARVLAKLGREPEGVEVLRAAMARLPRAPHIALELVRLTAQTGHFDEALVLGRDVVKRFPHQPQAHEMVAKALRGLARFDEADAAVAEGRALFPDDLGLAVEAAVIADVRGDWSAVLERGEGMVRQFPGAPLPYACVGGALKKLNRFDEADVVLGRAVKRFPKDSNLAMNHAWVASHRGDRDEALRRWASVNARFGSEPRVRAAFLENLGHAELARIDALEAHAASGAPPPPLPEGPAPGATPHTALLANFQSLGANCEFGFVQRHFGAEPMGLLRWAGIDYDKLLLGLDADFAGVGGAERTRLDLNASNQEYYTSDTLYGLAMHTFVLDNMMDRDALFTKMCRRLSFLRSRLLDDLASGDKIFVFHAPDRRGGTEARSLHRALRRHGPVRLLFVQIARDGKVPGTVEGLGEGLAVGYLDRTGFHNNHWNVSFDCWLRLCQAAEAVLGQRAHA